MKFGIRLPQGIPYGGLFEIFKNSIFFPENCVFRELGLRKNTATRRNTLVQHLGQTARPTTIKIGVHLREGTPYGGFFENFINSNNGYRSKFDCSETCLLCLYSWQCPYVGS